jgi:hypothetical protein
MSPSTPRERDSPRSAARSLHDALRTRGEARSTPAVRPTPDAQQVRRRARLRLQPDLQPCPALRLGETPDILAEILEDVVGHEHDRDRARELRDLLLASDPLLQGRERHRVFVAEREDLAVEDRAVGQATRGRGDFRESMRDELFTARPEVKHPTALDQLGADTVPLPLDQPVARIAERVDGAFEGRRQEERVRARPVAVCTFVGEEGRVPLG